MQWTSAAWVHNHWPYCWQHTGQDALWELTLCIMERNSQSSQGTDKHLPLQRKLISTPGISRWQKDILMSQALELGHSYIKFYRLSDSESSTGLEKQVEWK